MSLMHYRGGRSVLDDFRREINQLFNRDLNPVKGDESNELSQAGWLPAVDIKEDEQKFVLLADVPGVKSEDIKVFVDDNNRLVMKGERSSKSKEEKDNYVRVERSSGSFYRAFGLSDNVDTHGISAKVNHGMLEVVLPKTTQSSSREVPVEG